ncbi:sensor histidine kinase [Streptomyces sp. NPDC087440]|uniref:sensor histidine kinase n=1 Tax=Streptomyces sp. NPDC087440 TaxID=3365790 RepID=UPI0037FCD212
MSPTEDREDGLISRRDLPVPLLARACTIVALLCYSTVTVLNVIAWNKGAQGLVMCALCILCVFTVQCLVSAPSSRLWSTRTKLLALGAQALLTYVPFTWFGLNWGSMEGPMAASVLLLLPARAAWPVYALVLVAVPAYALSAGATATESAYYTTSALLCSIVIYGLSRLTELVHEVHATRARMARMAVGQERLRFARDLHDLLGYSLSVIALKGELSLRLIDNHPERARQETRALLEITRRALADVRLVASGYREMSLRDELDAAAAVLETAGVEAEVRMECGRLHPVIETVLATTLREGVTNLLRHSRVEFCTITASQEDESVLLTLVNDGVGPTTPAGPHPTPPGYGGSGPDLHGGSGLRNLRTRLEAVGGTLDAGAHPDGRFTLVARAPVKPPEGADGETEEYTGAVEGTAREGELPEAGGSAVRTAA